MERRGKFPWILPSPHFDYTDTNEEKRNLFLWGEGGGLLADEEKGEIKEIFPFSPFTHENEEKGESKGIFPFSPFT